MARQVARSSASSELEPLLRVRVRYLGTLTNKTVVYPGTIARLDGRKRITYVGLTHYDFSLYDIHGEPITTSLVDGRPSLSIEHPGHIGRFMAETEESRPVFQIIMPFKDLIRYSAKTKPETPSVRLSRTRQKKMRLTIEYIAPRTLTGYEQLAWVMLGLGQSPESLGPWFAPRHRVWRG